MKENGDRLPVNGTWRQQLAWFKRQHDELLGLNVPRAEMSLPLDILWPSKHLDQYLLSLTQGPDFLAKESDYPKAINAGSWLHEIYDDLRHRTANDHEHYMDIVGNPEQRVLLNLPEPTRGEHHCVPGETIAEHRRRATAYGQHVVIGSIHSHPHAPKYSMKRFQRKIFHLGQLSAKDAYILASSTSPEMFMGVATDEENVLAFRTNESKYVDLNYIPECTTSRQDRFSEFWHGRHGIKCHPGNYISRESGGKITDDDLWKVLRDISVYHRLVVYRGKPNQPFYRFQPPDPVLAKLGLA